MKEIENLWPTDLGRLDIRMPKEILLKQAQYLENLTKNILVGEVKTSKSVIDQTKIQVINYEFVIKVPSLGNYQFSLLRVMHDFNIYPIKVFNVLTETEEFANDETAFIQALKRIFSDRTTTNAINAVLSDNF